VSPTTWSTFISPTSWSHNYLTYNLAPYSSHLQTGPTSISPTSWSIGISPKSWFQVYVSYKLVPYLSYLQAGPMVQIILDKRTTLGDELISIAHRDSKRLRGYAASISICSGVLSGPSKECVLRLLTNNRDDKPL